MYIALRATHDDASLLVMSANNEDRDNVRKWDLARDKLVAFNSVASSAGSTATMAVVVQSAMGHLEVSTPGVGWSWGSTLTPNYGGLGGGGGWNSATQQLVSN